MLKHKDLQMFRLKLNEYLWVVVHPFEVVGRGSETQLQMGEKLNKLIYWCEGLPAGDKLSSII